MKNNDLYIVMSIDIDEDSFDKNVFTNKGFNWRGVEEGIPSMLSALKDYRDVNGNQIKYSWFIRCDMQLKKIYGDPLYLFEKYNRLWTERKNRGDELAWHFHPYDHNLSLLDDDQRIVKDLKECHRVMRSRGFNLPASRIGRAFGSNALLKALFDLGIKLDSSALPGRKRIDANNHIDWETTTQGPFYPSASDYRVAGKNSTGLLEVPMSMIKIKAAYDREPIKRYMNLTFKNQVIDGALRQYVKEENLLVAIMHPSEVVSGISSHALLSFDVNEIKLNLDAIEAEAKKSNKTIKYISISEVMDLVMQERISVAKN